MRDCYTWYTLGEAAQEGFEDGQEQTHYEQQVLRGEVQGLRNALLQMERMHRVTMEAIAPSVQNFLLRPVDSPLKSA